MAPMRVVLRVVANVAVAIIYVAVTVAVSSFVSDVSNVSAGEHMAMPWAQHSTLAAGDTPRHDGQRYTLGRMLVSPHNERGHIPLRRE